ncbi:MAG: T9SS type A sorting domain-containing protein [Candidatus Delongbacteria bacterium]|nr:T9SS type A sorting domain-containing protein [Candidatus Delongbacteria bacterium]MCG2761461.1 T9SS type A sorting domain-containing protein [Candidatus Delongbacteria bacterium]
MKRKVKVFLFFMLLPFIFICIAQEWTNVSPFSETSSGIGGSFISEDKGWIFQASNDRGKEIFYTDNGGRDWNKIYTVADTLEFFSSLNMTDSLHGWATKYWMVQEPPYTNYLYYLKTNDGGKTWIDITDNLPEVIIRGKMYFIDQNIGFFSGGVDSINYNAIIYKTVDGGSNWYLAQSPLVYDPYPYLVSYSVNDFFFLDEKKGWAACSALFDSGLIIYTSDGGDTWQLAIGTDQLGGDVYVIHFYNSFFGGAVGYSWATFVAITENNFQTLSNYYDTWTAKTICFQNDSTIWVSGSQGNVYRSIDRGYSFKSANTLDSSINKIQFFGNTGYFFGGENSLFKYVEPTGIGNDEMLIGFMLYQNYPNPFNPETSIKYSVATNKLKMNLCIFDSKGNKVKEIFRDKIHKEGSYSVSWNGKNDEGKDVGNGLYFYKMQFNNSILTRKMLMLK